MFPALPYILLRQSLRWCHRSGAARGLCLGLLVLWFHGSPAIAQAPEEIDREREYNVKAANLYGLGLHTEWPQLNRPAFRITVIGDDPFGGKLERVAKAKKTLHNLPMKIEHVDATDQLRDASIVFVPSGTDPQLVQVILKQLRHESTMVVGETPKFVASGGDASLLVENGKIKLELNAQSLARKKIRPTAQLLKIATIVQESNTVSRRESE